MSDTSPRTLFHYQVWDHQIISEFDLGELEPFSHGSRLRGVLHVRRGSAEDWAQSSDSALENRDENGDLWLAWWNAGDGYIARFPELCSFRIHPEQMRVDCAPESGVHPSTIAHLILDHAIPRLLSLKPDYLVLHASAFLAGDCAVAVLGKSGQGKSTLAGWFASQGFLLLTDDCLVLRREDHLPGAPAQQWLAQPSYSSVRLWPDSVSALKIAESELREFAGYSSKKRTGREVDFHFATAGAPLKACFVLPVLAESDPAHCGPPLLRRLSGNEAFLSLLNSVFRLEVEDKQLNRREFEALASFADAVGCWSLSYERKYEWLPEIQKAIMQIVQASQS